MEADFYKQTSEIEDKHWWFLYRRKLVRYYLGKMGLKPKEFALDLGCGTGGNLTTLNEFYSEVQGIELSKVALDIAKKKYLQYSVTQGNINKLSSYFPKESFDLVTLFNVLYSSMDRIRA